MCFIITLKRHKIRVFADAGLFFLGISQDGAPRGFDKTSRREQYYSIMGNLSIDDAFDPLHFSLENNFNAKSSYCFY